MFLLLLSKRVFHTGTCGGLHHKQKHCDENYEANKLKNFFAKQKFQMSIKSFESIQSTENHFISFPGSMMKYHRQLIGKKPEYI